MKFILQGILIFFSITIFANNQTQINDEIKQVISSEIQAEFKKRNADLDKKYEHFAKGIELKLDSKKIDIDGGNNDLKKDFNDKVNELNSKIMLFGILSTIFGLIGISSILGGYFRAKKYADKLFQEKVAKAISTNEKTLLGMVEDYDLESNFKKNKLIYVINKNRNDNHKMKKIIDDFEFNNVKITTLDDLDNSDPDLIVLNNHTVEEKIETKEIIKLAENYTDATCFLYFGTFNRDLADKPRFNFANSEFTLYPRIMETLKVQDLIYTKKQ